MKNNSVGKPLKSTGHPLRVAFVVGTFPVISETFIINQVADLLDRGVDVQIFSMHQGNDMKVSDRYHEYAMADRVHLLKVPKTRLGRMVMATLTLVRLLVSQPSAVGRLLTLDREVFATSSITALCWSRPFIGKEFDVVHCHMGTIATKYLTIRQILGHTQKLVTTFYGFDVSTKPKEKGYNLYQHLIKVCDAFLVMSENMKSRVIPLGIPEAKIEVHPISIAVEEYAFKERTLEAGKPVQITSVGRFVEKKGFDDLLRAIAIVKEKTDQPFVCNIVGDGELKEELHALSAELEIDDVIDYKGFVQLDDVFALYEASHLYVQASKTAANGDME